jgi:YcxB-like protein
MTNPLTFELVLDPAETVRASQEIERRARTRGALGLWLFWLLIPLSMAISFRAPARVLLACLALMGIAVLLAAVLPAIRRRQVRNVYAGTPALAGPQRYEFTQDGLAVSNESVSNLIRWSGFVEAAETPEFFLLYYSKKCAYYVPRRILGSEEQVDAVRRLLRERLTERAANVAPPT